MLSSAAVFQPNNLPGLVETSETQGKLRCHRAPLLAEDSNGFFVALFIVKYN